MAQNPLKSSTKMFNPYGLVLEWSFKLFLFKTSLNSDVNQDIKHLLRVRMSWKWNGGKAYVLAADRWAVSTLLHLIVHPDIPVYNPFTSVFRTYSNIRERIVSKIFIRVNSCTQVNSRKLETSQLASLSDEGP